MTRFKVETFFLNVRRHPAGTPNAYDKTAVQRLFLKIFILPGHYLKSCRKSGKKVSIPACGSG
jgi:hypothetical protein